MLYLAYGSNLHPQRLILRAPNVRFIGTTVLDQYRLTFHKRSVDGSSKCHLDYTENSKDVAFAAVFEIPDHEVVLLDKIEGVGKGYYKQIIRVNLNNKVMDVFVYLASKSYIANDMEPYDWYKGMVLAGARKHEFPKTYIQKIAEVKSKYDPDVNRRIEMENLLVQLEW